MIKLCIAFVIALATAFVAADGLAEELIRVDAALVPEGEAPALRFVIRNTSADTIVLAEADLPWGNPRGVVILISTSRGEPLKVGWPFEDGGPRDMPISPGGSLEGLVDLRYQSSEVLVRHEREDLVVFWWYRETGVW